ncbi:MAG: N-acetylmuramoyl-L-alanine amidase [Methylobacterium frigidaeris]
MTVVPKQWMPKCDMERVICHWTAGGYKASSLDRSHYHILIEKSGDLIRGFHSIEDNVYTGDGNYAAHTRGANTKSIGVSVCCMAGAEERPFDPGKFPMMQSQWDRMAEVVADLARFYGIPVTQQTILGHGEVEKYLGKPQRGKWDPMVLPWNPQRSLVKVGDDFRAAVRTLITGTTSLRSSFAMAGESHPMASALLNGRTIPRAVFVNEDVLVPLAELRLVTDVAIGTAGVGQMVPVQVGGRSFTLAAETIAPDDPDVQPEDWISTKEFADALDAKLGFDPERNVVTLTWG